MVCIYSMLFFLTTQKRCRHFCRQLVLIIHTFKKSLYLFILFISLYTSLYFSLLCTKTACRHPSAGVIFSKSQSNSRNLTAQVLSSFSPARHLHQRFRHFYTYQAGNLLCYHRPSCSALSSPQPHQASCQP